MCVRLCRICIVCGSVVGSTAPTRPAPPRPQAGVRTLSVRLGPARVFWACIAILEAAYAGAILVGLQSPQPWARGACAAAHAALGSALLWRARRTDLGSPRDISRCYMFTWGLFYAEYLLLPLYR